MHMLFQNGSVELLELLPSLNPMADPKHLPYDPSVISQEEYEKERQRLHDLIQKKNKEESQGVAEMLKHPLSSEQKDKQREAMNEQFRKGEEERRKRMRTSGK